LSVQVFSGATNAHLGLRAQPVFRGLSASGASTYGMKGG
jgi:hypothetical protein